MTDPTADLGSDPATRVRLRDRGLAWRSVGQDVIALDIDASRYHSINSSGRALWERLDAGATLDELAQLLISTHPAAAPTATGDVERFVAALRERGLVELVRPAG